MACRDGMCGGCESCYPTLMDQYEHDMAQQQQDFFTENARHALVAAANDLVKRGSVTQREMEMLEKLLDVFDPQEEVAEEADIAF